MTEKTTSSTRASTASAHPRTSGTTPRAPWLVPAAATAGLLVGALGGWIAATNSDVSTDEATPAPAVVESAAPTPAPTELPSGVTVPRSCLLIADEAQGLDGILTDGADAARDLDATRLSPLVREFAAKRQRIAELTQECRTGQDAPRS